jgi:hypothetical protein
MDVTLILQTAFKTNGPTLGVNISYHNGFLIPNYGTKPCFFIHSPFNHAKDIVVQNGRYRHLTFYKDGFFDYIVKKEFRTFQEWVQDCNVPIDSICFGFQKFDGMHTYISFDELMTLLAPPISQETVMDVTVPEDDLIALFNKLRVNGKTIDDIKVNALVSARDYMRM